MTKTYRRKGLFGLLIPKGEMEAVGGRHDGWNRSWSSHHEPQAQSRKRTLAGGETFYS